jgi:flagellar biosynthesis protein FlhF
MRIKSYFAKSVDEAMVQARAELGNDALLLNTRKSEGKPENYEVVFGTVEAPPPLPVTETVPLSNTLPRVRGAQPVKAATPAEKPVSSEAAPQPERRPAKPEPPRNQASELAGELERLHAQMDEIRALIVRSAHSRTAAGRSVPELADVYARLMASEVDAELSKDIVDRLEAAMATDAFFLRGQKGKENVANRWKSMRFDAARLTLFVRAELERRVRVAPQLGGEAGSGAIAALVGPTGAGKTTTLMKLAASDIIAGRTLRLVSLDTGRVSGHVQLQSFASNLGIAFATVASIHALPALVAEARKKKELLLIDTPGYAGTDHRSAELAASVFQRCAPVDVHVVVPGYMKGTDLRRCLQRYQIFQPSKLLVTKLDETQFLGAAFSEGARAGLGMSFLTHGPAVPEDIRAVRVEDFLALALDPSLGSAGDEATKAHCA